MRRDTRNGRPGDRRGATMVLTAVMMTALLGFVALAVDMAVLTVARHQLAISADAAALAGAAALADERRINPDANLDIIFASARGRATEFAEQNAVLGQAPVIVDNTANAPEGDVVLGYIADPHDPASPFISDAAALPQYNSVRVRTARSAARGGIIPASFARAIGIQGTSAGGVGTATALNYSIRGFSSDTNRYGDLLPIVLDESTYENMISGNGTATDSYTYDPATKTVTAGSDGIKESKIFPVTTGHPGNWGTANIGVSNNSTNTIRDQIRNGVPPSQMKDYFGNELALNRVGGDGEISVTLGGNPGISAGMKDALEEIIGQARTIPIYRASSGNGNNVRYTVIGFAPVRVLGVNFQGNNKYVIVQPALSSDPTAIPGEVQTDWSAGGLIRLNLSR